MTHPRPDAAPRPVADLRPLTDPRPVTDLASLTRRAAELLAGLLVAVVVGAVTLGVVNRLPFVEPSWLPEAFGSTLAAGFVVVAGWLLLRRATGDRLLWALGTAGPAFLSASHLGLVLGGTPHYLFGLGGDQINRVTYLTRFADSPALADPFYADAAPFYPPQWFWVGGRLAALLGVDGWEFYKPYAILTMAVAGAIAFVAWRWLVPTRLAVLFGLVTSVIGGHTNAYEPYSWILICLLPQVVVATILLCRRAAAERHPMWPLVVTIGVYLGWAALGYTLIAGFAALLVGLVVVITAWRERRDRTLVRTLAGRLLAMAGISAGIALITWHPFLVAVLGGAETEPSVANHFAPETSASWPLPMFEASAVGLVCLIGVVWVVVTVWPSGAGRVAGRGAESVRARLHDDNGDDDDNTAPSSQGAGAPDSSSASPPASFPAVPHAASTVLPSPDRRLVLARAFGLTTVTVFAWFVLSGLRAVTGSSLLPFRMIPPLTLALALAGVVGTLALARWAVATTPADSRGKALAAAVVVAGLAAVQMVQHVSEEDTRFAAAARENPGMPQDVLGAIDELTPDRAPSELVVLTSDPSLSAYRPYFMFQAPSQAYATPTGRYEARTDALREWSRADSSAELAAAMDASDFRAPDVLVLERDDSGQWVYPAVINEMPRVQNNSREDIEFRPALFADTDLFEVRLLESRVVVVRR